MRKPQITVAMPFYNSAGTLDLTIRSLLNQSCGDFELLLCDDGSTDASLEIARGISDNRVTLWSDGQRKRLATRLNECIDKAQGQYFARMDADDVAYPQRLERQLSFLRENPLVDLCATGALILGKEHAPLWAFVPDTDHSGITRAPYRGFPMLHPTWMGRIEWFRKWRYDESAYLAQDQEILMRAYRESTYANLPEILLGFRQETVPLRKLFRLKLLWIQYVRQSSNGPKDISEELKLVVVQAIRFAANCIAKLLGPGASLPRQYGVSPSFPDKQRWKELCSALSAVDTVNQQGLAGSLSLMK